MKRLITLSLLAVTIIVTAFTSIPHVLTGRWEFVEKTENGPMHFLANFRADETYDAYINKKPFLSGNYHFQNDTLVISDHLCDANTSGTYKITFLTPDSILFSLIKDPCTDRIKGTDGATLSRVKAK